MKHGVGSGESEGKSKGWEQGARSQRAESGAAVKAGVE
jgi:hypothetical protein